ncbi:hypothetical protein HMPREF2533_01286 [Bacteroides fragilis]|nr:hypothetical protein HMPREF2530_01286 [Bacteroides fragilis]KXU48177.1 hypothetical protein HMPREF2533_01286 [Bacteroides fragilis]
MLNIFGNLMDVVVRQRMYVLLPVDIFSQLLSVKSSQSCIGSYPYKSFWLGIDTTYSRGKSLLQGNLFIVVMAGFQREATDSKKYGQPGQKAGIWIVFHGCFSITLPAKVTVCIDVTKKMEIKSYLCTVLFSCLSSLPGSMEEEAGARLPL